MPHTSGASVHREREPGVIPLPDVRPDQAHLCQQSAQYRWVKACAPILDVGFTPRYGVDLNLLIAFVDNRCTPRGQICNSLFEGDITPSAPLCPPGLFWLRLGMYIMMCVMMGTIYLKLQYSWQDR